MQKAIECLRQRTLPTQLIYHLSRKEDLPWKVQNHLKEGQKNFWKFEIIRKLETYTHTINNIKNRL
jgi:hypothetical protein